MIKKFFKWAFRQEFEQLQKQNQEYKELITQVKVTERKLNSFLHNMDVSVDVHEYNGSKSWAVVSIQGQRSDFIKFVDLGDRNIYEIERFLRQFDRSSRRPTVDCSPQASHYLRIDR